MDRSALDNPRSVASWSNASCDSSMFDRHNRVNAARASSRSLTSHRKAS